MANIYCIANMLLSVDTSGLVDAEGRVFGIDGVLLQGIIIQGLSVFILFIILSYLLFEPAKKMLNARTERIKNDIETATKDKEEAAKLKDEYDARIKEIDKEAESILSEARKKAKKKENDIIAEANDEAARIVARGNQEIELEKSRVVDEVRKEMISVATVMAEKIVAESIDEAKQEALIEETLKEMGDSTWLSK